MGERLDDYLLVTYLSFVGWSEYDSLSYSKTWRVDKQWWDACDRDAIVSPTGCFFFQLFILLFIFAFSQLTDDQLAAFKEKAQELASLAGLQSLDQDCDPFKDTSIGFVKG